MEYLPNNLRNFELCISDPTYVGGNSKNMQMFAEGMKLIPKYLQRLNLELQFNNLGESTDNIKWLGVGLTNLPKNIQSLRLDLSDNDLGGNSEGMKLLGECMK